MPSIAEEALYICDCPSSVAIKKTVVGGACHRSKHISENTAELQCSVQTAPFYPAPPLKPGGCIRSQRTCLRVRPIAGKGPPAYPFGHVPATSCRPISSHSSSHSTLSHSHTSLDMYNSPTEYTVHTPTSGEERTMCASTYAGPTPGVHPLT